MGSLPGEQVFRKEWGEEAGSLWMCSCVCVYAHVCAHMCRGEWGDQPGRLQTLQPHQAPLCLTSLPLSRGPTQMLGWDMASCVLRLYP